VDRPAPTVIASYITAEQKYRNAELPVFLLAEAGRVVADDAGKVTFEQLGTYTRHGHGKDQLTTSMNHQG
jgi:hypothetical protein